MEALLTWGQSANIQRPQELEVHLHPEGIEHEAEAMTRVDGRL